MPGTINQVSTHSPGYKLTLEDILKRHLAFALLAAALVAGLAGAGCAKKAAGGGPASAGPGGGPQAIAVAAATVRRGDITSTFALTGNVVPAQQANLTSVISGAVRSVAVQIGEHVRAGELIVQIDDSTLQAQLQQDEAQLASAQSHLTQTRANDVGNSATANANLSSAKITYEMAAANLRRNQQLLAQGYVSQSAFDQAQQQFSQAQAQYQAAQVQAQNANLGSRTTSAGQADIKAAQAAVAQAQAQVNFVQAQIAQSAITSPFDGVVTQRNVDPGSLAAPSQTLVQVSQVDPIFVNVGIPDEDLQYVSVGRAARVVVDTLPGRSWTGKIQFLNAGASQGTLSYLARIAIPNSDLLLKSGMVANVTFVQANRTGVLIAPRVAIAQTPTGNAVYIAQDKKAKMVPVKVGVETQNDAEISGPGIAQGTQVITQRPDSLQDGSPINIVSTSQGGGQQYSSQTSP